MLTSHEFDLIVRTAVVMAALWLFRELAGLLWSQYQQTRLSDDVFAVAEVCGVLGDLGPEQERIP